VTLFGYGNASAPADAAACNHYWECRHNQSRYFSGAQGNHDWHAQWRAIEALVAAGAVRYRPPAQRRRPEGG